MKKLTRIEAINQAVGRKRLTGRYVNERKIMSQSQFSKKTRNPKLFTIDELSKLDELVHFSDEELLALFDRKPIKERKL